MVLGTAVLVAAAGFARGQASPEITSETEHVAALGQALRIPVTNPAQLQFRQNNVGKRIDALRTLTDLGQALLLLEWNLPQQDDQVVRLNASMRARVVEKFEKAARAMLRNGPPRGKEAAARLISEIGVKVQGVGANHSGAMGPLSGDLARLLKDPDLQVRVAAIDALGKTNPPIDVVVPALTNVFTSDKVEARRAAASALGNLVKIASKDLYKKEPGSGVVVTRDELVNLVIAVAPIAGRCAEDDDAEVCKRSLDALNQVAVALANHLIADHLPRTDFPPVLPSSEIVDAVTAVVPWSTSSGLIAGLYLAKTISEDFTYIYKLQVEAERTELLPVGKSLERQAPHFRAALVRQDEGIRLAARKTLAEIGYCRVRLQLRQQSVPPFDNAHFPREQDPIFGLYRKVLPELDEGMNDPNDAIRLATLEALEMLRDDAVIALDPLKKGLHDSDHFVRWAAVRIMGRIPPAEGAKLVPDIAAQLEQPDLDLRRMTAMTLDRYGAYAKAAIPALRKSIFADDPDMRKAAIAALAGMGTDITQSAIPDLIRALGDDTDTVRRAAADALGRYGPAARDAVPALTKMQQSDDAEDRKAATYAVLQILQPPEK
jgi:HEAT repeat protein